MSAMATLAKAVAESNGITLEDMLYRGPGSRQRRLSWPRQRFMLLAHRAGYTTTQIGRFLGGLDHTTVLHGIRRAEERSSVG